MITTIAYLTLATFIFGTLLYLLTAWRYNQTTDITIVNPRGQASPKGGPGCDDPFPTKELNIQAGSLDDWKRNRR